MGMSDVLLWDEENIFFCPALAAGYPNEIIAEMPSYPPGTEHSNASVGAFLTNDEMASMGVLGLVVNRSTTDVPDNFLSPRGGLDLIYAKNLGGFGFGGMLTFARNSYSNEPADTASIEQSTSVMGITPGVAFVLGEKGSVDLGFGFHMISFSDEDKQNDIKNESDGAMAMGAELRAMLPMGQYVYFIPHFHFGMSNLNWKTTSAGTTTEWTECDGTMFGGGIGLNVMPFEETTVLAGFSLDMASEDNSDETWADSINSASSMTPALVFGVESRFNSWMTGRVGARKSVFASQSFEDYHGDKITSATDSFMLAVGLGLNIGDFSLDAKLHEDFLFTGPEFIGGTGTPPTVMLSAEYNFSGM
jgi:hypothetical protein